MFLPLLCFHIKFKIRCCYLKEKKKNSKEDFQDLSIHKYELVEIRLNIYIYTLIDRNATIPR